jgi:hypothetical protein
MKPIQGGKHPNNTMNETTHNMNNNFENIAANFPEPPDLPWPEMLIKLVEPYMAVEPEIEELEEKLELGQIAWNMAVMKKRDGYLYHNYRDNFLAGEVDKKTQKLIDDLVKDKEAKFGEYDVMLDDCEIIDDEEGRAIVNVVAKSYEQFMHELVYGRPDDEDGEDEDDDYEDEDDSPAGLKYVNRSAIALLPKQPFRDWLKIQHEGELDDMDWHNSVYLIKTTEEESEVKQWLQENFQKLFENELNNWTEDEDEWPENRDYELFTKWFDVQLCGWVYDVQKSALTKI